MCSGDFGQFYCVVGSSSPLFFTGFLQAKVIKRVIRMLKTDVNNRNETAVTDERLGQREPSWWKWHGFPLRSPPPACPFSSRASPASLLVVAVGGRPGTLRSKLHSGGAARLQCRPAARRRVPTSEPGFVFWSAAPRGRGRVAGTLVPPGLRPGDAGRRGGRTPIAPPPSFCSPQAGAQVPARCLATPSGEESRATCGQAREAAPGRAPCSAPSALSLAGSTRASFDALRGHRGNPAVLPSSWCDQRLNQIKLRAFWQKDGT